MSRGRFLVGEADFLAKTRFGHFVLGRMHRVFIGVGVTKIGVSDFSYTLRYLSFHFPCRSSKSAGWSRRSLLLKF